jgi:hypothetical protein
MVALVLHLPRLLGILIVVLIEAALEASQAGSC